MSLSRLRSVVGCDLVKVRPSSALVSKLAPCAGREVSTSSTRCAVAQQNTKPDWNRAVSEAEKIVGYPTSFLSLRWVLSDEIANVALHLRKLVGSNHPLLKTAKNLLYNGKNNMQAWGLIVLLVSKAAGHSPEIPDMEQDKAAGVLHSQRALAEVAEMIRTSHLVHKGLVNMNVRQVLAGEPDDMLFGNKIALLSGDYLLANSCTELANLRNQELVELMSSAVRDLVEAEFLGDRDQQNNPLPSRPLPEDQREAASEWDCILSPLPMAGVEGCARREWAARHVLAAGALLGKSCSAALKLAGHKPALQTQGYLFGCHLALAWQAFLDLEAFTGPEPDSFSLVGAPLAFTLEARPELYSYIEAGKKSVHDVDYHALYEAVLAGDGIQRTQQLQREHSGRAREVLDCFPYCDARTALANIIVAMNP
ncbi:all trans-polyprenyl-diphosphate synthase PDSS2 isoform X2 [Vanessa cardui]|uniref:all trans-polyprenyl-diphosphate synthase PDSS2 isoform X1 n=1 Tax=Vanessa cardui TaxID=171605 RepID=UPI001F13D7DF|nr:all trans-polyprenyl-diphosphate synthase PDSS2 isoform X1 [Vanessa cardui]XP_046960697.1 all trans-polyprenyl-diphosphate synthase PDSS2 isoform X2 [Vanessa cardui]